MEYGVREERKNSILFCVQKGMALSNFLEDFERINRFKEKCIVSQILLSVN
jgi:hypothetical protein